MKRHLRLIPAPTSIQPGEYVAGAYPDAKRAETPSADLAVEKGVLGWRATLSWRCGAPVREIATDTNRFADAAALLVPAHPDAPMISMGAGELPVEGFLWRADWKKPMTIRAEGFGTVERQAAPNGWGAIGVWQNGIWSVRFEVPSWPALERQMLLGVAIWQGAQAQRAGLKSVTGDWLKVRL